jgi:hypothetical protein
MAAAHLVTGLRLWIRFSQEGGVKRCGQQCPRTCLLDFSLQVCEDYGNVATKLPNNLPASSARRSQHVRIRHHGNRFESVLAFRNRFEDRHALGAACEPKRGVLHIAPGENSPGFRAQGRAYPEIRKWGMRVFPRLLCRRNQRIVFAHPRDFTLEGSAHVPLNLGPRSYFTSAAIRGITARTRATNWVLTRSPVSITSA